MKVLYNLFCRDIEAQMHFYGQLLGLTELASRRSPIYRALQTGDTELGFNAMEAYALLNLGGREPAPDSADIVTGYATFMLDQPSEVDLASFQAKALGGGVIKPPYQTYYGQWQAVLHDPEQRVFRVSAVL